MDGFKEVFRHLYNGSTEVAMKNCSMTMDTDISLDTNVSLDTDEGGGQVCSSSSGASSSTVIVRHLMRHLKYVVDNQPVPFRGQAGQCTRPCDSLGSSPAGALALVTLGDSPAGSPTQRAN
jgi:hypothetical protein